MRRFWRLRAKWGPDLGGSAGHALRIYNKEGQVYGDDRLDHVAVVDDTSGKIYFIGGIHAVQHDHGRGSRRTARRTLLALEAAGPERVFLQKNTGETVAVRTTYLGPGTAQGSVRVEIAIQTPTRILWNCIWIAMRWKRRSSMAARSFCSGISPFPENAC
jgi:hypothetical protein